MESSEVRSEVRMLGNGANKSSQVVASARYLSLGARKSLQQVARVAWVATDRIKRSWIATRSQITAFGHNHSEMDR